MHAVSRSILGLSLIAVSAQARVETLGDATSVTVNRSEAVVLEERSKRFLRLRTFAGAASPGAYYGGGTGNKVMLGFRQYDQLPVADFRRLSFRTKVDAAAPHNRNVYVNFVVDLECDPLEPDYAVLVVDEMARDPGPKGRYNRYRVRRSDPVFKSVGGKGGLPGHLSANGASLANLLVPHPEACFVNLDPFDNGMPRDTRLPALLLVLGDSATAEPLVIDIDSVRFRHARSTDRYDWN